MFNKKTFGHLELDCTIPDPARRLLEFLGPESRIQECRQLFLTARLWRPAALLPSTARRLLEFGTVEAAVREERIGRRDSFHRRVVSGVDVGASLLCALHKDP
jgi:hypothetical protein